MLRRVCSSHGGGRPAARAGFHDAGAGGDRRAVRRCSGRTNEAASETWPGEGARADRDRSGRRWPMRVDACVDAEALARVLDVLGSR